MGTRSLTVFHDEYDDAEIVVMYGQFDGYPEGHGKELHKFLDDMHITNGIPPELEGKRIANGMGCLAAQTIAHFKTGVGNFYLYPAGTRNAHEEYIYHVRKDKGKVRIDMEKV